MTLTGIERVMRVEGISIFWFSRKIDLGNDVLGYQPRHGLTATVLPLLSPKAKKGCALTLRR